MKKTILFSSLPDTPWWGNGMPVYSNNWMMHKGDVPENSRVVGEHTNVYRTISKKAVVVRKSFPQNLDSNGLYRHDAVFVRDACITNQKGDFVISNFKVKPRRPEADAMEKYLLESGYNTHRVSSGAYTEGGEYYYCLADDILFAGLSRNNFEGLSETVRYLNIKHVCVISSKAYHLDTIFTVILDKKAKLRAVIACMELVQNKEEVIAFLKAFDIALIEIASEDAIEHSGFGSIAVNCLPLPGILIGGGNFKSNGAEEKIRELGIEHIVTPATQFLRSGGGIHCLTNELS